MTKYLGIDWGDKKSGLAISDNSGTFAFAFRSINSLDTPLLLDVIRKEKIETIVVGRPRNMDGSIGKQAKKVDIFVKKLKKLTPIQIDYEDETATSALAKKMLIKEGINPQKNKDIIDRKAAQLILQGYLDEKKN